MTISGIGFTVLNLRYSLVYGQAKQLKTKLLVYIMRIWLKMVRQHILHILLQEVIMLCPKCRKEMERGELYSPYRFFGPFWCPQNNIDKLNKNLQGLYPKVEQSIQDCNMVVLTKPGLLGAGSLRWTLHHVPAWICRECKCGVFDYSTEYLDEEN